MIFQTERYNFDKSTTIDCGKGGFLSNCYCQGNPAIDCPSIDGDYLALSDDHSRMVDLEGKEDIIYNSYWITMNYGVNSEVSLNYRILDLNHSLTISNDNQIYLAPDFTMENSVTLNGKTFDNVIVFEADTSEPAPNPIYETNYVWKTYFNKEYGVVGFHDAKTKSLFCRQ